MPDAPGGCGEPVPGSETGGPNANQLSAGVPADVGSSAAAAIPVRERGGPAGWRPGSGGGGCSWSGVSTYHFGSGGKPPPPSVGSGWRVPGSLLSMAMQSTEPRPLAGGRDEVSLVDDPINPAAVLAGVSDPAAGAVVLFLGTVRDHSEGKHGVTHLEYEAYREHVEAKIAEIVAEARAEWPLRRVAAVHRVGSLAVGEVSVAVAVSAGHRAEAFSAGRYLIDELKRRAPIWKKEHWPGGAEWVREDLEHSGEAP